MIEPSPTWSELALALQLFRDPILCAVAAGGVLGYLGVLVLLRRLVFFTASIGQCAGFGVALGFWAGIHLGVTVPPLVSALVASVAGALVLSAPVVRLRTSQQAVLGLVWLFAGGGAVIVGSRITQESHDLAAILFGTAVLVRPEDLWLVLGVGSVVLFATTWTRQGLVLAGFDPDAARVQGLPVRALDALFLVELTVMIGLATRALGALPVFAFSVLPAMAAMLASSRLPVVFPLALAFGAVSGGAGYLAAFVFDLPVGATQTIVAVLLVLLALPFRLLRAD